MGIRDFLTKAKRSAYIFNWQENKPKWSTQKDADYIKEGQQSLVWVYACVSMISSCVSSIPWKLYRQQQNGRKIEIEAHPILTMLNKRANEHMSSRELFDFWATYLALLGKFYGEYVSPRMPTGIWPLYPHRTHPLPDRRHFVSGFEYRLGADVVRFKPEEVLWSKFNDPLDVYEGLSPIRALRRTIDTENEGVDWNKATLQNSGSPPGAFKVQGAAPDLKDRLREDWLKRYGGSQNARVPLVLNADKADWVQFGLSPVDMDFLNQRKVNRIEICSGFGIPGQVVGDPEGQTYANYEQALKAMWENTIIPRYLENIKTKLNQDLLPRYADNLVLEYDLEGVEALHESRDAIFDRMGQAWQDDLITRAEAREQLGYETGEDDGLYRSELRQRNMAAVTEVPAQASTSYMETKALSPVNMNREQKRMYWKQHEEKREEWENKFAREMRKFFRGEKAVIEEAMQNTTPEDADKEAVTAVEGQMGTMRNKFTSLYVAMFEEFGENVYNRIMGKSEQPTESKSFDAFDEEIMKWISNEVARKVKQVANTTKQKIRDRVAEGVREGEGIPEIAKRIDSLYLEQIIPNRSVTIARTETLGASNKASIEGARQTDIPLKKQWISTGDGRTREDHEEADGQTVGLDEMFEIGGSYMDRPGDGPAEQVVMCRCTVGYQRS